MSDPSKRKDPNAPIQIELDQVQLYDPGAVPPAAGSQPGGRRVPPPLPTPAPFPAAGEAPPPSAAKTIAYVAMIVVLVGLAIVGGLMVGTRARSAPPPAPSVAQAPTPTATTTTAVASPSAAPSASAAPKTLTMPTIEMH
jgi:hypothetical protein